MHAELEVILKGWKPVSIATPRGTQCDVQESDMRRLLEKVVISATGCWLHTGSLSAKGYSCFKFNYQSGHGHRFAYQALVGPIPEGLEIDHRQDSPPHQGRRPHRIQGTRLPHPQR